MSTLLAWQREGYPRYHRDRTNLILHILSAPFFWLGMGLIGAAFFFGNGTLLLVGLLLLPTVMAIQGRGHRREEEPPVPFLGPIDALRRLFSEQLINFPRFVFSGGWSYALAHAKRPAKPQQHFDMPYGLPETAVVDHQMPPLPSAAPASPAQPTAAAPAMAAPEAAPAAEPAQPPPASQASAVATEHPETSGAPASPSPGPAAAPPEPSSSGPAPS